MDVITFDLLRKKLKNAPQSVLERVIGYVDAILETPATQQQSYTLTDKQQKMLDKQVGVDKKLYTDAGSLYNNLKNKYEL